MSNFLDFLGRVFISSIFLLSGYNKVFSYSGTVSWMEGFGIPGFLLAPTIVLEIILPILIIVGYQTKIAATLLSLFCLLTALIFHNNFLDQTQLIAFLKNISLAGGLMFLSINDTKNWALEKKRKYVRL